ncbi:c1q globular head like domain containing protein [uncultured Mediterranean phage uvMED]|nr:c1q globular head like domain containing protein [uncultured Mediterranean phage uvMED]
MSYIGNQPAESYASFERQVFTIVNSQTAYTLSHSVVNENDIRLVVNNVVQEPGSGKAYTAANTTLTLSAALVNGTDEMYCVFLGRALQTVNPPAASVGNSQTAPTIITGQTAETSIATDDTILIHDTSASALRKMTRANFVSGIGGDNTPAFQVLLNSAQSISSGTNTVVAFDTEIFDTDNAVSSGVFTVPSGKAGKYFFTVNGGISTGSNVEYVNIWLSKNDQTTIATTSGWAIAVEYYHQGVAGTNNQIQCVSGTFDLAVGDSVKVYILQASGSSHNTSEKGRFTFSGHKLIT